MTSIQLISSVYFSCRLLQQYHEESYHTSSTLQVQLQLMPRSGYVSSGSGAAALPDYPASRNAPFVQLAILAVSMQRVIELGI